MLRPRMGAWSSALKRSLFEAEETWSRGVNRGDLKNLWVGVNATVERILFSRDASKPSAVGVIYTDTNGKSHRAFVRQEGEVILSAGAIGSPQLLLLSGIGPFSCLLSLHIPLVHSQPNVGRFFFDNPNNGINFSIPFPIELPSRKVVGITNELVLHRSYLLFSIKSLSAKQFWKVLDGDFRVMGVDALRYELSMFRM
ncbi:hypothetical protein TIFTF001_049091 [Ficus carica]|uniref:Glucose-methanol-choline oxidoreductase N-terminal domain-containing protein n=1 Tax=Ficus carica TaxID=3494 RepID=A0AA88CNK9_FICCA|nr:hypothetical protein TIFTF001_049091 [Ficus carica]